MPLTDADKQEILKMRKELDELSDTQIAHGVRLNAHDKRLDVHDKRHIEVINAIESNTAAMENIATAIKPITEMHRDLQGTAKVGKAVQEFLVWLTKWGAVGGAIVFAGQWLLKISGKIT